MSDTYKCKSGFLIYMNDDGDYLPFLVKVRDNEIIWNKNVPDKNIMNIIASGSNSYEKIDPTQTVVIQKNNWNIEIRNKEYITMSKEIMFNKFAISTQDKSLLINSTNDIIPYHINNSIIQCTLSIADPSKYFISAAYTDDIFEFTIKKSDGVFEKNNIPNGSVYVTITGQISTSPR